MEKSKSFVFKALVSLFFAVSFSTTAHADIGDLINYIIGNSKYGALVYAHSTGHGTVYFDEPEMQSRTDEQAVAAQSSFTANDTVEFVLSASPDTGYKFDGWDDSNPKSGEYESDDNPYTLQTTTAGSRGSSSVIPLHRYAFFSPMTYSIYSSPNGGVGDDFSVPYTIETSNFNIPPCPYTRDGYTFTGWNLPAAEGSWSAGNYSDQATVPQGSYGTVTLEAQWQEIPKAAITINVTGLDSNESAIFTVSNGDGVLYTVALSGSNPSVTIKDLPADVTYTVQATNTWSWAYGNPSPTADVFGLDASGHTASFTYTKNTSAKKHDEKSNVNWRQ